MSTLYKVPMEKRISYVCEKYYILKTRIESKFEISHKYWNQKGATLVSADNQNTNIFHHTLLKSSNHCDHNQILADSNSMYNFE